MESKNQNHRKQKEKEEKKQIVASQDNTPVIPLPNPGEGGPVYPGMQEDNNQNTDGATPVIPLPNPGEGGPVYPNMGWPNQNTNPNPFPIPNQNQNQNQNSNQNQNQTGFLPTIIGTIISTYPRPNEPCNFCISGNTRTGNVRFLNAASDYNPFLIYINESMFTNKLNFGEVTDYEKVSSGAQIITIMGENGYVFIQKAVQIVQNMSVTIAIVPSDTGLDLKVVTDGSCERFANMSCVRAVNLAYNSGALNVVVGNQAANFPNMRYLDVADFTSVWPGVYIYVVTRNAYTRIPGLGNTVLLTATLNIQRNKNYTIYLVNWKHADADALKAIVVEEGSNA